MSFTKFQRTESSEVLPPDEQEKVSKTLHKIGKRSAKDLDTDERAQLARDLNPSEQS